MAKIKINRELPIIQKVVAIHLYRKAGLLTREDFDSIDIDSALRKLYYMLGDNVATELWNEMKNMGGSVSG